MTRMGNRPWGMILLGVYLVLIGVATLFSVAIPSWVTGVLALAAGILLLLPLAKM